MKTRRTKTTLLESSIQNLRNSMGSLSMDQFVLQTIESLMSIERNEFLDSCTEDKGNGSYTRAFQSLSKNGLVIKVPRTRSGDFSPDTLELLKINQKQIDDICLSLYKKRPQRRRYLPLHQRMFWRKSQSLKNLPTRQNLPSIQNRMAKRAPRNPLQSRLWRRHFHHSKSNHR